MRISYNAARDEVNAVDFIDSSIYKPKESLISSLIICKFICTKCDLIEKQKTESVSNLQIAN